MADLLADTARDAESAGRARTPRFARRRPAGRDRRRTILAWQLLVVPIWLLVWQLTYPYVDELVGRSPASVWSYLTEALASEALWTNLASTMQAVVVAFLLAAVFGIAAGIGLALLPTVEAVLRPFLDAVNAMPRIALAPVFILYFGIGPSGKIALAFSLVFFVVMSSSRAGILSVDPDVVRLSRVLGISPAHLFTKVYLPTATPGIFAGLRLGFIYSLMGVVGSELIAAEAGLGQLIAQYSSLFQMEGVYGILLVLAVIAGVINALMRLLEATLLRWQPPEEQR